MERRLVISALVSLPVAFALRPMALASERGLPALLRSLPFGLTHEKCIQWSGLHAPRPGYLIAQRRIQGLADIVGMRIAASGASALIWQRLGAHIVDPSTAEAIEAQAANAAQTLYQTFSPTPNAVTVPPLPREILLAAGAAAGGILKDWAAKGDAATRCLIASYRQQLQQTKSAVTLWDAAYL
jgi:hypothetical protein